MTRSVILARHAESDASAVGIVNGDPSRPIGLSERGREEGARLGEMLRSEAIDLCVVTQFPRTHETAAIALAGRDVPLLEVPELNDPSLGELEGRRIDELRAWFRRHGPAARVPGGGESRVEAVRRFCRGLRIIAERPEGAALVVAHGLPVTYAVLGARGDELPLTLERAQVDHATPYRLTVQGIERAVEAMERWASHHEEAA